MTIEDRLKVAIEDLAGLLAQGATVADALTEIANENGLMPHVLKLRAEKALGPLELVAKRTQREKTRIVEQRIIQRGAEDYYEADGSDLEAFLTNRLGRAPTQSEKAHVAEDLPHVILRKIISKLEL